MTPPFAINISRAYLWLALLSTCLGAVELWLSGSVWSVAGVVGAMRLLGVEVDRVQAYQGYRQAGNHKQGAEQ